ncbi:MAG: hypothetical protein IPH78_14820 [Bacteroidetes bacterium]|nr:hypothetical protein [Bacteroidota bacterium]
MSTKFIKPTLRKNLSSFYMADSIKRVLVLKPEKPIESLSLQEIYMTKGFNWLPHYFLKLKDEKNGRLEMKATVENYAEELKDAELELVVGSPQMSYSQVMDPMTYDYITNTVPDNNDYRSRSGYMQANAVAMKVWKQMPDILAAVLQPKEKKWRYVYLQNRESDAPKSV